MIYRDLQSHQWRRTLRSPGFYGNLFQKIMLWFSVVYFSLLALIMGILLPEMLEDVQTNAEYWQLVAAGFGYYIVGGVLFRLLMQNLGTMNPLPYYVLPIPRKSLVRFITLRPLLNPINYFFQTLVLLPFLIRELASGYIGWGIFLSMFLTGIFASWFNVFISSFIRRQFSSKSVPMFIIMGLLAGVILLEYFEVIPLFDIFLNTIPPMVGNGLSLLVMLAMAFGAYWLNAWYFSRNYYEERFTTPKKERSDKWQFAFLDRWGTIGNYIGFSLKLIFRHKRTKASLITAALFIFYGLLMYNDAFGGSVRSYGLKFFTAMFITGAPMMILGQFVIGWDANHFDFLMTRRMDTRSYLKANYLLMIFGCVVWFVASTPYFLMGREIVLLHVSAFLYNIGFNTIFLLFVAPYNTKRLSLNEKSAMSYQGTTYKSFLITIPMMFLPWIFVGVMALFFEWQVAVYVLAGFGVLCLLLHKPILNLAVRNFLSRKYALCEGFRKKEAED